MFKDVRMRVRHVRYRHALLVRAVQGTDEVGELGQGTDAVKKAVV